MVNKVVLGSVLAAALAAVLFNFKLEVKSALMAATIQTKLFGNAYFGGALLMDGFSADRPQFDIDIGYWNNLKLKGIWLGRYFLQDQFAFKQLELKVQSNILQRLTAQYKERGIDKSSLISPVAAFRWGDIDQDTFFKDYVQKGVPVVIKGFPSKAAKEWTPAYFAKHYGDHKIDVIDTLAVRSVNSTISDFVQRSSKGEPLYLRSLSDIFDKHPELSEDIGFHALDDFMRSQYMTAQIFMGNGKVGSGTSYHCANFNNLFFQVAGRKKWTFVDPQYEALMYPMFNAKSMDVASFLTTVVLSQPDVMAEYFPLYALAPKLTAVLEPGDVLMNPPWYWHMIENLDSASIGVATRWFLPSGHQYQNSLHSTLQFFSTHMWNVYYTRVLNKLAGGINEHKPTNTPPMDERINFGKKGSAMNYIPRIFPESFYAAQGENYFVAQEE